jgi:peptidoglycan/xylan/chitin deacetylase (PgdA/CDA1 family)
MSDVTANLAKRVGEQAVGPGMHINILIYHSISDASGPTCISPEVFADQIDALAGYGYRAVPISVFAAWHAGETEIDPRSVVITFDDGFADFALQAFAKLNKTQWPATIFLPSGKMGGLEDWAGGETSPPRPLLQWEQVADLARDGVEFGSHSVSHPDLTALTLTDLRYQLQHSRDAIAEHTGRTPTSFAAPYGRSNATVRAEIGKYYRVSVGTRLQRANRSNDVYNLPRIEMHYFRDLRRWHAFLEGRGEGYFACRRALRGVKDFVTNGWSR